MNKFLFCNCTSNNENMFFFSSQDGLLAKYDYEKNLISYMPTIVKEFRGQICCIDGILVYRDKIYAVKTTGNILIEYDLYSNTYECYNPGCANHPWANYFYITEYQSKIFMFVRANYIKVFDCETKEFVTIKYSFEDQRFNIAIRIKNKVWLFPLSGRNIVEFDLKTLEMNTHVVNMEFYRVCDCYEKKNEIYILGLEGNVWILDIKQLHVTLFRRGKEGEHLGRIVVTEKNVILLPALSKNIIIINKNDNVERIYSEYPESFQYSETPSWSKYCGYCKYNDELYFAMRLANHILIINEKSGEISWKRPYLPKVSEKMNLLLNGNEKPILENVALLEDMIEYISGKVGTKNRAEETQVGATIWNYLK